VARPEIGAAPRFRAKAPPATYRYDSSLAPALDWDSNPARETAAFLLSCIEDAAALPAPHDFPEPRELKGADGAALLRVGGLADAVAALKRMQAPFAAAVGTDIAAKVIDERWNELPVIRRLNAAVT
jgi:adenine-specific DNA-methyltransferase